jgi:hypothetical protein
MITLSIDFSQAFGAPADMTQLTTQLQDLGVRFSSTCPAGVVWFGANPSVSSYAYAISGGFYPPGTPNAGNGCTDPVRIDFDPLVSEVSIRGFDGGGDIDTMILKAFSSSGGLLDTRTFTDAFAAPGQTLSVTGTAIAYVTCEVQGTTSGLFFDDLRYTLR